MSKPPELIQIQPEDYKKEDRYIGDLLSSTFNNYLLQLNALLTKSLTFGDNIQSEIRTLEMSVGSSVSFKLQASFKPSGLLLVGYTNKTNPAEIITVAVGNPQWSYDGKGNVIVQSIPGLTSANKYMITLLVI